jgi:hypothetical protein
MASKQVRRLCAGTAFYKEVKIWHSHLTTDVCFRKGTYTDSGLFCCINHAKDSLETAGSDKGRNNAGQTSGAVSAARLVNDELVLRNFSSELWRFCNFG